MRKVAILPTLLTLGNGVCGFTAIAFASKIGTPEAQGNPGQLFAVAGWLILLAMVFDMLDGYVARLSQTASEFGGQLDSLCDAISFGVAPAFLLLKMGPGWERPLLHQLVAGIATLYMVCAILRLARFNVDNTPDPASHRRFKGLPSPAAAGCLASLAIFRGEFPEMLINYWRDLQIDEATQIQRATELVQSLVAGFAPLGALVVALLMVSQVPYPHVTKQMFRRKRHGSLLIQILLAVFIVVQVRQFSLLLIFWGYVLGVPAANLIAKHIKTQIEPHIQPHGQA